MPTPLRIACLDLATVTGHAVGLPGEKPRSGTVRIADGGARLGYFLMKFNEWLMDWIAVHSPNLIYYEAPILRAGETTPETILKLNGLAALTACIAEIWGIQSAPMNNMTVKKFFAGSGRAQPVDMVRACHARGWHPADDNEADALGMFALAEHEMGVRRDSGPLLRGVA